MKNIIISAFADEYSSDLNTQLEMLGENGIGYIEPRFLLGKNVADLTANEAHEVARKLSDCKIGVSAIGSPLGKIKLSDDFDAHLEKTRRVLEIANILGTDKVRMFSFYLHEGKSRIECRNEVIDKLGKMLDLAEASGIKLCHENEAEIYGESPEECLDLLTTFGGKLRAVFDMGNFVLGGYKPFPDAYDKIKSYVEYFHIKDALYAGAIVPPGRGEASIGEVLRAHSESSEHPVYATLEPHLQTFDGLNSLVGRGFDNPYKFESKEVAFLTAINNFKEILK